MKSLFQIVFIVSFLLPSYSYAQVSYKREFKNQFTDSINRMYLSETSTIFKELDSLYLQRDFQPIYDKAMSLALLKHIDNTELWGFEKEDYAFSLLDSLYQKRGAKAHFDFEMAANKSYLLLIEDVLNGKLKTEEARGKNIHLEIQKFSKFDVLKSLADVQSLLYLILTEPQEKEYLELKNTLEIYQLQLEDFQEISFQFKDTLQLGDRDSNLLKIKEKLLLLGDYKSKKHTHLSIYDEGLKQAVSAFQKRHLLPLSGYIDKKTITKLNIPVEAIIIELQLNLERWRWLPETLGEYYAFANLPAFEMSLVKADSLLLRQNMVCGKVSRNTPVFSDTMTYIDINPTWTVPPTILQKDILPAAQRSNSYLTKKNIKVLNVSTGHYINSSEINWANARNYKFIQGPGLNNSLGIVKFIFPNNYYIFFHDTPHKEHFNLPSRAYSSGCIRLAQPLELAEVLLSYNATSYNRTEIDSIVTSQKTKRVLLSEKPAVYIQYITQEYKDGLFYNYPDVYNYNEDLKQNFFNKD